MSKGGNSMSVPLNYLRKTASPMATALQNAGTNTGSGTVRAMSAPTAAESEAAGQALMDRYAALPATPAATEHNAAVDQFKNINYGPNGTATGLTAEQNLSNTAATDQNDLMRRQAEQRQGNAQGGGIPAPQTTPTIAQPMASPVSAQTSYTPPDYAALAAARTAAALAQKKTIAEAQKSSLDRSFARDGQITQDNRTLENAYTDRTLSPFSGKTSFDKGMIGRERSLVDESKSNNLSAQKSNIDSLLADYQNATADEQVRIADELQRADRQYNLDLAQVTGTINGQKTASQSNADRNFNQNQQQIDYAQNPNNPNNYGQTLSNALNELKLGNYSTEQKQQATLFEQQVAAGKMSNEAAEYNLKQLKDPNSAVNRSQALDLQMKELEAKNLPEKERLELQQLKKQIAQIGVVHYKPQTENEIAMDKVQLETAQKQLEILKGKTPASTPVPSKDSTNNLAYYQDQTDNSTHSKADKLAFAESKQGELTDADYKAWVKSINDNN
jgi:hypothetical protein